MPPDLRRALAYLVPYWRRLAWVVILSLASTLLALALPYLTKEIVDRALLRRDLDALLRITGAFGAVTLANFGLNAFTGLRYTRVSADILFDMRLALFRHLQTLSPRFFARMRLGEIVSRLNNDIGEIQRVAAETALAWLGNVLFLAGTAAMMLWLDAKLFLAAVALLPFSLWALRRYRVQLESRTARMRQASADIGSFLIESLRGIKLVVTTNSQQRERTRFAERNESFVKSLLAMQRTSYLSGGVPGLILSAASAVVFLAGGYQVIRGEITIGTFAAFLAYQMRLFAPVQAMFGLYSNLATVRVSMARVHELLDEKAEVVERPEAKPVAQPRGEIVFDGVSFRFDRQAVLDGVSFRIEPGRMTAIVGPSGSGKSTIADLMVRLLDPDGGSVRLDGVDLRDLQVAGVREAVALVDQEPFLLHATVEDNIRFARPEASHAQVTAAAEAAGIAPFIESLPKGYATVVGEEGSAMSAGERQRIALARALLLNPAVLVLDEPTSALDADTEAAVMDGYGALAGRTVVVITHRPEVARRASKTLAIENGRVRETVAG